MGYVTEAYPIVVYCRQLENKQRRITNISECEILPDGSRRLQSSMSTTSPKTVWRATGSSLRTPPEVRGDVRESAAPLLIENRVCPAVSWRSFSRGRRQLHDNDPTDRLHWHDCRAFYGAGDLPRRNERQHLFPADCCPGSIRADINETTKRKKAGFFRRRSRKPRRCWPHPGVRGSFPWCAWPPWCCLPWAPASPFSPGNAFLVPVLASVYADSVLVCQADSRQL